MIRFFKESRYTVMAGGVAGVLAGAAAFVLTGNAMVSRIALAVAVGALVFSMFLYVGKLIAVRKYQEMLLLLYEKLDTDAFFYEALPMMYKKCKPEDHVTLAAHVANGYMTVGNTDEALRTLRAQSVPEQAYELRGLIASNIGTACLQSGDLPGARRAMADLKTAVKEKNCKEKFKEKARHILAYQQLCMDILEGKNGGKAALEKDYESSHSLFHKINAGMFLVKIYKRTGEKGKQQEVEAFILEHGNQHYGVKMVQI